MTGSKDGYEEGWTNIRNSPTDECKKLMDIWPEKLMVKDKPMQEWKKETDGLMWKGRKDILMDGHNFLTPVLELFWNFWT